MKKLSLIFTVVAALALIATACNISFTPPAVPQGPQPGQPGQSQPGQPQPEPPQPGQPQPGQPQPGQPQPGQPQPGQPQPGQPQPGQPQPGQPQPGQPPMQPTATKKSGGGGGGSAPVATPTATLILAQIIQLDLEATDMYVDSGHYLHIGVKNNSTYSGNISYDVACTAAYRAGNTGDWSNDFSYTGSSEPAGFNANQERWTNSKIYLDKGVGYYKLTCQISSMLDTNASNNTVSKTLEITP